MTFPSKTPEMRINGVSVTALYETVGALRESPSLARYRFRARNQWLDGGHTRTTVKDFFGRNSEQTARSRPFIVDSDTPAHFRGGDRAMDPLEHLLAALAASITTTLVWHAAIRRIHLDTVETLCEGDIDLHGCLGIDETTDPGFREIRADVLLEADLTDEELDSLVRIGTRYSPLFDTLRRGTNVRVRRVPAKQRLSIAT